jgi:hypothetical protein
MVLSLLFTKQQMDVRFHHPTKFFFKHDSASVEVGTPAAGNHAPISSHRKLT